MKGIRLREDAMEDTTVHTSFISDMTPKWRERTPHLIMETLTDWVILWNARNVIKKCDAGT